MKRLKYGIPNPPYRAERHYTYEQNGMVVRYIWIFDDEGARIIENQYATARKIMKMKGCSQATAYRLTSWEEKRYWVADLCDRTCPRCFSALPCHLLRRLEVQQVGNPGFRSGVISR